VPTVAELLRASGLPQLDARALLAYELGATRESLVAHPERPVTVEPAQRFAHKVTRRLAGEPLAYLTGEREFYGRTFRVGSAVLVPRPETELLVRLALELARGHQRPAVLDLGTGSGCIAITLALEAPHADVTASDVSTAALEVARANGQALGAPMRFVESNWYAAVAGEFDLIVSNPPYVAQGDPHLADLRYEPELALLAGPDGLSCVRPIVAGAPAHLKSGGWLLLEHGFDQASAVRERFSQAGFEEIQTTRDDAGLDRVTSGRLIQTSAAPGAAQGET